MVDFSDKMTYKSCDEEYCKAAKERKKYNISPLLRIGIYIAVASLVFPVAMAGDVIHGVHRAVLKEPTNTSCCDYYRKEKEEQKKYGSPMLWIGIYIAAASLVCSVAMAGDVIAGVRRKKIWFPCKFFTMNAASLTILTVATKLPVDLTTVIKGTGESVKLISTLFLITAMGNFLTSFASMDSNAILLNIVALGILVITIIVDLCIQIRTGAIGSDIMAPVAVFVLVGLLLLFVTLTFSVLTVPTTKRYLELKYGELHKKVSNGETLEETGKLTNQNLKEVVEKYWVMAETSSPQYVMARSVTSTTSGVICLFTALLSFLLARFRPSHEIPEIICISTGIPEISSTSTSYRWSTDLILSIQLIGIFVGTIAPTCRWLTTISFNCRNLFTDHHHKEFKLVETYWIQRWVGWKERPLPLRVRHLKCKKVIADMKILVLNLCIGIQILIVVASKLVQLISIIFVLPSFSCFYYCKRMKEKLVFDSNASTDHGSSEQGISGPELDINDYVLLLEGEAKLPDRILKNMRLEMNQVIQKGKNRQPKNLKELLSKSNNNFKGVADFDSSEVSNCWTLPVVTLTSIAVALPNIESHRVDWLINSVSEGLSYVSLVEESFSSKGDNILNMKCAADVVWAGIELYRKWLDKDLRKLPLKGITVEETLKILVDIAEKTAIEFQRSVTGGPKVLAANSMHRISQTLLKDYEGNTDAHVDNLFEQLSIMIADILGACLSNLPHVIVRRCYCSAIEEREKSVRHAARLLGETGEILEILGHHLLPCLSGDRAAYIDEWRAFMMQKDNPSILSPPQNEIEIAASLPQNEIAVSSSQNEVAASGSRELHIDVDE